LSDSARGTGRGTGNGLDRLIDRLSNPRGVAVFWIVYGCLFSAIYFAFTRTLALDDAVSAELMQRHLAPAYQIRNPPAFEWMLWLVQQVFGPGLLSFVVLRYALIAAFGVLTFAAVRQATGDRRLAAAFSVSLPLFFWLGWDFHYRVTHSLGLLVFGLGAWIALIRYREIPSAKYAVLAGLLIGAALVSKWNVCILFGALFLVFIADPKGRAALANWRTSFIVLGALVPILPPVLWLLARRGTVTEGVAGRIIVDRPAYLEFIGTGVLDLVVAVVLFLLPWLAFVAGATAFSRATREAPPSDAGTLALRTTVVALLIALGLIPFIGAVHTDFRYMYPLFLVFPVGVAGFIASRVDSARFARIILVMSLCMIAVASVMRIGALNQPNAKGARGQEALRPYEGLAENLANRGFAAGDIVTLDPRDAGNLGSLLPAARVRALGSNREDRPSPDTGRACLVLWHGETVQLPAPLPALPPIPGDVRRLSGDLPQSALFALPVEWRKPFWGPVRRTTWFAAAGPLVVPVCAGGR
jgi:4-amino-4-deoxy-L-arabinose transferase-like glycosyltransferase